MLIAANVNMSTGEGSIINMVSILHFPDTKSIMPSEKTYLHNDSGREKQASNGRLTDKTWITVKASDSHEGKAFPLSYRKIESSKMSI